MTRLTLPLCILGAGLALSLGGCGKEETTEVAFPADEAVTQSAASQQVLNATETAALDGVLEHGGAPASAMLRTGAGDSMLASMWPFALAEQATGVPANPSFTYANGTLSIANWDLDQTLNSADRYPNSTGLLDIEFTASSVTGNDQVGSADFSLTITADGDVTHTNPNNGAVAVWPSGSSSTWTMAVEWSVTDASNWSYSADITKNLANRSVTVTPSGGSAYTAVVDVSHAATRAVNVVNGTWNGSFSMSGTRHAVWTAPSGNTWDVVWDVRNLFDIRLTVNGQNYGPYTIGQILRRYSTGLETEGG
ncbi:MAG: hypothetical protein PF961_07530 [Planctomycetota bacterium]|jgi:hypothetical protein|nr:hypothetical protein [Planctomycetota bacterium]